MSKSLRFLRRLAFGIVCAVLLLAVLELLLVVAGVAPDPSDVEVTRYTDGRMRVQVATPVSSYPVDQTFPEQKTPGVTRIVFLGASTTAGIPFAPASSFPAMVVKRLETLFPDRPFEGIVLGVPTRGVRACRDLALVVRDADIVVVEAGHNEFLSSNLADAPAWLVDLRRLLDDRRLFRLLRRAVAAAEPRPGSEGWLPELKDDPVLEVGRDAGRSVVERRFRQDLTDIVRTQSDRGAQVVLLIPPSNWVDYWPEESRIASDADRAAITTELRVLEGELEALAESPDRERALRAILACDELLTRSPELALAEHWRGLFLVYAGRAADAFLWIERAYRHAVRPVSAAPRLHDAIRAVAADEDVVAVDAQALFVAAAECGLVTLPWLVDHCHPSIEGQYLLATAALDGIRETGVLCEPGNWPADRDPDLTLVEMMIRMDHAIAANDAAHAGTSDLSFALVSFAPVLYAKRAAARLSPPLTPGVASPEIVVSRAAALLIAGDLVRARQEFESLFDGGDPPAAALELLQRLFAGSPRVAGPLEELGLPGLLGQ